MDQYSQAIGLTDYDISKLSWGANLVVSVGGILATQIVALSALFLLWLRQSSHRLLGMLLGVITFTFAFDLPFQLFQALGYRGLQRWPTGVDLMDFMLLLQREFAISQLALKGLLITVTILYLAALVWIYERTKMRRKLWRAAVEAA
jgi:hypothetical protein